MNGKHIDYTIKTNQLAVFKIYFTLSKWIVQYFCFKEECMHTF